MSISNAIINRSKNPHTLSESEWQQEERLNQCIDCCQCGCILFILVLSGFCFCLGLVAIWIDIHEYEMHEDWSGHIFIGGVNGEWIVPPNKLSQSRYHQNYAKDHPGWILTKQIIVDMAVLLATILAILIVIVTIHYSVHHRERVYRQSVRHTQQAQSQST